MENNENNEEETKEFIKEEIEDPARRGAVREFGEFVLKGALSKRPWETKKVKSKNKKSKKGKTKKIVSPGKKLFTTFVKGLEGESDRGKKFSSLVSEDDDGRGRPKGTYKARYVPGIGVVKVPTDVYRKLISEAKAKKRLMKARFEAQRLQMQERAEQIASSQDPRFQPSAEEGWLASEDPQHQMEVERLEELGRLSQRQRIQRLQQPRRPIGANILAMAGSFMKRLNQPMFGLVSSSGQPLMDAREYPGQQVTGGYNKLQKPFGQLVRSPSASPFNSEVVREPKVSVFEGKSKLLSNKNGGNNKNSKKNGRKKMLNNFQPNTKNIWFSK
jgi:hypothetical protein